MVFMQAHTVEILLYKCVHDTSCNIKLDKNIVTYRYINAYNLRDSFHCLISNEAKAISSHTSIVSER